MAKVLDYNLKTSPNSSCAITFPFEPMPLRKVLIPLSSQQRIKLLFFYKDSFGIK